MYQNTDDVTENVNTDDVTTEKIIIEPRILQKNSNEEVAILNQQTTEVDNESTTEKENTADVIAESSSSIPGNATEPLVIIDPRKLNDGEMLSRVNMKEIDYQMAKDLKLVRQIDESRQQQYQQVVCNDRTAPLAGTSIDKFYVVQSPFYPKNYPTYLW